MQTKNSSVRPKYLAMADEFTLHVGEGAMALFTIDAFLESWDLLYSVCPWATVFQSRMFVTTWYQTYRNRYLPIVIRSYENGALTGLLTLARDENGQIFGAGESQAEYQVWLASNQNGTTFIIQAFREVCKRFKGDKIQLKFIPEKAPMSWVKQDVFLRERCLVRTFKQPFIKVDDAVISQELRKKNRKEKINRLKRIGDLRFERITDIKVFTSILDELILQFDFRKNAMFGRSFFLNDSLRKEFLLSLYKHNLLHATVLRLNNEIIASNIGAFGEDCVHLQGINTHAPFYAKYSPGILHFLMLCKLLADERIAVFDLTPGESSYKDDLATDYGITYELTISSVHTHLADHIRFYLIEYLKKISVGIGIKLAALRDMKRKTSVLREKIFHLKKQGLFIGIQSIIRQIGSSGKIKKYFARLEVIPHPAYALNIKRNSLHDLLHFEPSGTWMTRREFLADAMHRFELMQNAYTFSENGLLVACVWLGNDAKGAILLDGFYYHKVGLRSLKLFLLAVASTIAKDLGQSLVLALTCANDKPLHLALEAIGFKRESDVL